MIDSAYGAKMLNNILLISVLCCATVYASPAASQLTILSAPKSLDFQPTSDALPTSALPEFFAACLGSSVRGASKWSGLRIADPFSTPLLAVSVVVSGAPGALNLAPTSAASYQLTSGQGIVASLDTLAERVHAQHTDLTETPVKLTKLAAEQKFASLKPQSNAGERKFVEQVAAFAAAVNAIQVAAEPTLVSFNIDCSGLDGAPEAAKAEGQKVLVQALKAAAEDLEKRFAGVGGVLVSVVETSESVAAAEQVVKRQKRQAVDPSTANWNLAEEYNEDYPVMFNIILWFGVIFVFSLYAIAYAIGGMDPGRDSIIYRMTSTRIKKDN